jgi:hypothetical protein
LQVTADHEHYVLVKLLDIPRECTTEWPFIPLSKEFRLTELGPDGPARFRMQSAKRSAPRLASVATARARVGDCAALAFAFSMIFGSRQAGAVYQSVSAYRCISISARVSVYQRNDHRTKCDGK